MLYGMGTVFVFLSLMVFVLFLLARGVKNFPGSLESTNSEQTDGANSQAPNGIDPAHLKAIELAMKQHYQKR